MKALAGLPAFVIASTAALAWAQTESRSLTLDAARQLLQKPGADISIGSISLAGFSFSRELEIGRGMRVMAISRNLGGGLAAFRADGSVIATAVTNEILWLQLFDLNEDRVSEVITEELQGRGTGVLAKVFCVYAVSDGGIKKAWQGESYFRQVPWDQKSPGGRGEEKRGYLRFDPSGAGLKARMTYLVPARAGGAFEEKVFEMEGDAIQERAKSRRVAR